VCLSIKAKVIFLLIYHFLAKVILGLIIIDFTISATNSKIECQTKKEPGQNQPLQIDNGKQIQQIKK
jgi:hypothetical protein